MMRHTFVLEKEQIWRNNSIKFERLKIKNKWSKIVNNLKGQALQRQVLSEVNKKFISKKIN